MKKAKIITFFSLTLTLTFSQSSHADPSSFTLMYDKPASTWTEALPIGNGRLGAMIFGNIGDELIQLNEATLWSGGPVQKNINPKAFDFLAPTRAALINEDYRTASDLVKNMQGLYTESYLPLGDLQLKQEFTAVTADYYRELNIRDGLASTRFTVNGVRYYARSFCICTGQYNCYSHFRR
jgi:alpha-L-fucosidase 2